MDSLEVLATAFDLPPKEAQEYLRKKGVTVTKAWDELTAAMHTRSFTVAGVAAAELLQDLKDEFQQAMDNGETWQDFRKSARARLGDMGWSSEKYEAVEGDDGSKTYAKVSDVPAWRWELIYRQNMQTALNAGRFLNQQALADVREYLQFLNINDNRSSDICPQYSDLIAPVDHPIWGKIYPTNHFRCRSRVRSVSQRELERDGLTVIADEAIKSLSMPPKGFDVSPVEKPKVDLKRYDEPIRNELAKHMKKAKAR